MRIGLSILAGLVALGGCKAKPLDCAPICEQAAECEAIPDDMRGTDVMNPLSPEELAEKTRSECLDVCERAKSSSRAKKFRLCAGTKDCDKLLYCLYPGGSGIRESERPLPGSH